MSLKGVAKQTLTFLEMGHFTGPNGVVVQLVDELQAAVEGTRLYTPEQGESLLTSVGTGATPTITVTRETTQVDEGICGSLPDPRWTGWSLPDPGTFDPGTLFPNYVLKREVNG